MYGDRGALKSRWQALGLGPERIAFAREASAAELV